MISTYDEEEGDSEFNRNEPICNANTGKHEVNQGGSKCSPRGRDGWDILVLLLGWVDKWATQEEKKLFSVNQYMEMIGWLVLQC